MGFPTNKIILGVWGVPPFKETPKYELVVFLTHEKKKSLKQGRIEA